MLGFAVLSKQQTSQVQTKALPSVAVALEAVDQPHSSASHVTMGEMFEKCTEPQAAKGLAPAAIAASTAGDWQKKL